MSVPLRSTLMYGLDVRQKNLMIRKATKDDLEVVARLRYAMFASIGTAHLFVDDFIEKTVAAYAADYENGTCAHFVEEIDDVVIGCAGGRIIRNELFRNPVHGYIMDVYVEPRHRRRGIATGLTEKVIEWIMESGVDTIRLHAAITAVPLYERLGFENSREMKLTLPSETMVEQIGDGNAVKPLGDERSP